MHKEARGRPGEQADCVVTDSVGGGVEEALIGMFAMSEETMHAEQRIEGQLSEIIQDFLSAIRTSSDSGLKVLTGKFTNSNIPEGPSDFGKYLEYLSKEVVIHSVNGASPRFIGHMVSALPYFVRPLARLMTAINQNPVKAETSKALSLFERQALIWMHRLVYGFSDIFYDEHGQNKESTLGILVSGGTLSNVTALWCARNRSLGPTGTFGGVEKEGLHKALTHYGYEDAVIIGSSLMHYSFEKAAGILGMGSEGLVKVPVDENGRIKTSELQKVVDECRARSKHVIAMVGVAGTTEMGSIDPLPEMADVAEANGIHFHVDAAWGGPLLFSRQHRGKLAGLGRADTVTIDGHKQMYLPMGIGIILLRDPAIAGIIEKQARYVLRSGSVDLGKRSLEGSRPAMSLFLHAAINVIGRRGYEILIDEGIRKTRYMAGVIRERPEFELLAEPPMNILSYRYIPERLRAKAENLELSASDNLLTNKTNQRLQRLQRTAGHSFVSRTTLNNTVYGSEVPIVALRVVIANPLTTEPDIDAVLAEQLQIAEQMV